MSLLNRTSTAESYTLSLHDALPICDRIAGSFAFRRGPTASAGNQQFRWLYRRWIGLTSWGFFVRWRSEEHTSELQSLTNLVCRLLLEKKHTQSFITKS